MNPQPGNFGTTNPPITKVRCKCGHYVSGTILFDFTHHEVSVQDCPHCRRLPT